MLLLPLAGQYEQMINASYAQKLGLALSTNQPTAGVLEKWINFLDKPLANNEDILWPNNKRSLRQLDKTIQSIVPA